MTYIYILIPFAIIILASIPGYVNYWKGKYPKIYLEDGLKEKGFWGLNNLKEARTDPDAPQRAAILAQEWSESDWAWKHGQGIKIIGRLFNKIPEVERRRELWGHECEVQAASLIYDTPTEIQRLKEANLMATYDEYPFKQAGWSEEKIEREMKKRSKKAHEWVQKRLKKLEEFVEN